MPNRDLNFRRDWKITKKWTKRQSFTEIWQILPIHIAKYR
ncbi:hypothetical protein Bccel_0039 [Pseudobacteroides cellulosolvens ATCC 35603 = DSM 2933]|uniref:Uncharacterized protein n=1 Tax=Pseudobacteroides cellulosolvens ATCC 35603 = DSM 2933 TaxID=398512 RepID=A0A0L6JH44_9FIRM|nr:hypothetical protein Bccel_0039 [Pseudobacteroides cellulosolvens ATCC 35603 = DSM 2933]